MYVLLWILIGSATGWWTGKIFRGSGYGPLMDMAMGICGGVAGGTLVRFSSIGESGGIMSTTIVTMVGASVLTLLASCVKGRGVYARQL
jgi:uncharacterized membrane protein YeaQ/YmgE (transglycosylase-associated protein family)